MLSSLAGNSGLDFIDMTKITAGSTLDSGIYYITKSIELNKDKTQKNGLAVAENATVYLYIPENLKLTVYGGNGADATNAGEGSLGSMVWIEKNLAGLYVKCPYSCTSGSAGAAGSIATGGGAAIYVPQNANLVILGKGELEAHGGNGGNASQGELGMSSFYWEISVSYFDGDNPHTGTNDARYSTGIYRREYAGSVANYWDGSFISAGAGGTGGNGAGGGGAAIGTNGANGVEGAEGAEGASGIAGDYGKTVVLPRIQGVKGLNPQSAEEVKPIYVASTVTITGAAGKGGDAYSEKKTEKWSNNPVGESEFTGYEDKFVAKPRSHVIPAADGVLAHFTYTTDDNNDNARNYWITNARRGGNGGAGGNGALVGKGGAGGGGGDSGSVVDALNAECLDYYTSDFEVGDDGDSGTEGASAKVELPLTKRPYNTITFKNPTDHTETTQNYYLGAESSTISLPGAEDVTAPYGKQLKGWKVTKAAKTLSSVNSTAFTATSSTLVTVGQEYALTDTVDAAGVYGDVELEAVFEDKPTNTITFEPAEYKQSVTDNGENAGNEIAAAWDGQSVKVTAQDRTSAGYKFIGFTVTKTADGTAYQTITVADGSLSGTFTMPAYAVTVTANYEAQPFTATPVDCNVNTSAVAVAVDVDTTVTISSPTDKLHTAGKDFVDYTITKTDGGADAGITITYDPLDPTTGTFTMPAYDVTVTANYTDHNFTVAIVDNTCTFTVTAGGVENAQAATARMGDTVSLTQGTPPQGQHFERFVVLDETGAELTGLTWNAAHDAFAMPAQNVQVKAEYSATNFTVSAAGCTIAVGTAPAVNASASAQMGSEIVVTAPEPQTGYDFKSFTLSPDVDGAVQDLTHRTLTFTMPDSSVTVTTSYALHDYELTLKNGITVTADAATGTLKTDAGKTTATYGTRVYLTKNATAPEGKEFTGFKVTDANGHTVETHVYDGRTYFDMPASDVTVEAEYGAKHYTITVNGGTFTVDGASGKTTAAKDQLIALAPANRESEGLEFKEWVVDAGGVTIVDDQFTMPADNVEITAEYKKIGYDIDADNTSVTVKDPNGTEKTGTPNAGDTVEIVADDLTDEGYDFIDFTVTKKDGGDVDLTQKTTERKGSFTMPVGGVDVKANYKKKDYIVSVGSRGSFTVTPEGDTVPSGSYSISAKAQVKDTIVFTAEEPAEDEALRFAGWEFQLKGQPVEWADIQAYVTDGTADSLTVTFRMPPKDLTATPVYRPIVGYDIVFEEECGFARVDGKRTTAANAEETVTITAAARDGLLFDYWEMFYGTDPDAPEWADITAQLAGKTSAETTFTMPDGPVTLRAHYIPAPTDQGGETISAGGKAAIGAAAAVGVGLVAWQGSELAMRIYRNKVIQIDYWPGNRISLAQLIWSRAGSPEPESDVPFADITEALDTLNDDNTTAQKAARWCVEQGLLDAKTLDDGTECFEPMKHVTHLRVCLTWQNARKMGLFEVPAETE